MLTDKQLKDLGPTLRAVVGRYNGRVGTLVKCDHVWELELETGWAYNEEHLIIETTTKEIARAIRNAIPCACDDCKDTLDTAVEHAPSIRDKRTGQRFKVVPIREAWREATQPDLEWAVAALARPLTGTVRPWSVLVIHNGSHTIATQAPGRRLEQGYRAAAWLVHQEGVGDG